MSLPADFISNIVTNFRFFFFWSLTNASEEGVDSPPTGLTPIVVGHRTPQMSATMEHEKRMRREIANSNERRRMQSINAGFQNLRTLIPHHEGEKLSKVRNTQHYPMFRITKRIIMSRVCCDSVVIKVCAAVFAVSSLLWCRVIWSCLKSVCFIFYISLDCSCSLAWTRDPEKTLVGSKLTPQVVTVWEPPL